MVAGFADLIETEEGWLRRLDLNQRHNGQKILLVLFNPACRKWSPRLASTVDGLRATRNVMQTTQTAVFERRPPRTRLAQYSFAGPSLHSGMNAPPPAAQAFVPGVASGTQAML